ncbi:MAG: sulfite exporter TauE/SafE family protein [Nitrosomonadales bacterium]|nr:sulfite exporter TauE/SafE family protein [Nitrosomonadales bacterium]
MTEFSIFAVFLVGLLGGVHCLGMCGSIVGIFTTQMSKPSPEPSPSGGGANRLAPAGARDRRPSARWPFHLAYSSGRILSYTAAGALVGAVGQAGLLMRDAVPVQHLLFALSSFMLVALGLYLAGVWGVVRRMEHLGGGLWKRLQPYTARLLPVNTVPRALGLGALWGWLPCGLVYSVLLTALASGGAMQGALVMLAFGLGTLPNLLAIGLFWESVKGWVQSRRVRLVAGGLVASLGVYGLIKVGYTFAVHGWTGACHVAA